MATISPAFVTIFDSEVKQAFQASRQLAGMVREKMVTGDTVKFNKLSSGVASVRTPQTEVTPMNLSYSLVTATMTDYIASEYSDIFNQSHVSFSDRSELSQAVGNAIGRRLDQVVIDALDAATSVAVANTVAEDGTTGSASDMNTGKIRAAKAALDANNVPPDNRVLIMHANSLEALLSQTSATSSDFNSVRALVDGSLSTWLGMDVVMLGDRTEGGMTKDGSNDRLAYAFHKSALGLGMAMNQKTEVNYIPDRTSYLVSSMFSGGAVAIDDGASGGIVKITSRES
jgi:hypothetical protein|tara:strand:+ start:2408 stop:3265 length:858 start_codon:yes stop_codon:yes gene_type:complete